MCGKFWTLKIVSRFLKSFGGFLGLFLYFWRCRFKNMKGKPVKKGRDWIMEKKERRRRQGRYVHKCICLNCHVYVLRLTILCNTCWCSLCLSVSLCVCRPAGRFELTLNTLDVIEGLIFSYDSSCCAFVSAHPYHMISSRTEWLSSPYSSWFHTDYIEEWTFSVWLWVFQMATGLHSSCSCCGDRVENNNIVIEIKPLIDDKMADLSHIICLLYNLQYFQKCCYL